MRWTLNVFVGPVPGRIGKGEGTGKGHPITGHDGPEGEERYSSTISLTSALDGLGGQIHASAALDPGKETRYTLYREGLTIMKYVKRHVLRRI